MLRSNISRAIRYLRHREGLRQRDLGLRAKVSAPTISRLEQGHLRGLSIGTVEDVAAAVGASVDVTIRWRGEQIDRLIDAAHAGIQEHVAASLQEAGWTCRPEVSFNHYGDRGRVDVLAFHPDARVMLIVEVKASLADLQETLGRLDVKVRLGRSLADASGWNGVRAVVPAFVFGDTRAVRRTLARHAALFTRFSTRGRVARAWLRRPAIPAPSGLIWFVSVPEIHGASVMRGRRVRTVTSGR